jgi:hypothetical protein
MLATTCWLEQTDSRISIGLPISTSSLRARSLQERSIPADFRSNLLPPPVQALQLTADDVDVDLRNSITLPPGTHRIEINYSGLSLTDPIKVTFRYRMLGFDSQWSQASTRRFVTYPTCHMDEVYGAMGENRPLECHSSVRVNNQPCAKSYMFM